AGLAEVVKYGAIMDAPFLDWLEANAGALLARSDDALAEAIARSCAHKAALVARDPREHGERALLNLGHTFARAIGAGQGYAGGEGGLNHGGAVDVSMVLAARLSTALGLADAGHVRRLASLMQAFGLETDMSEGLDPRALLARMRLDKKAAAGGLRFIVWDAPGSARIVPEIPESAVLDVLQ